MKYKIGQKVKFKKYEKRFYHQSPSIIYSMKKYFGKSGIIKLISSSNYFKIEGCNYWWNFEWLEPEPEIKLPDYLFKM